MTKIIYLYPEVLLLQQPTISYGAEYFDKYRRYSQTTLGQQLHTFRQTYTEIFSPSHSKILDYGCGYGELVVQNDHWYGYDIMEETKCRIGDKFDSNYKTYKTICFFDVLEHLYDPIHMLKSIDRGTTLIISIPLLPKFSGLKSLKTWKHYRPSEHILYSSPTGLETMMLDLNYDMRDHNTIESGLGREDIHTYCFIKS